MYRSKNIKKSTQNSSLFNLHTNEWNTTFFLFDESLKGSKPLKTFNISLTFRFDNL
jgi:hypothetical protein